MKPGVKRDGSKYWQYILCYVDDILSICENPKETMDYLKSRYTLKAGSVKEPDVYLGAQIKKWYIAKSDDPAKARWAMLSEGYMKQAIQDMETELSLMDKILLTKVTASITA
jgi:hypothetical protein